MAALLDVAMNPDFVAYALLVVTVMADCRRRSRDERRDWDNRPAEGLECARGYPHHGDAQQSSISTDSATRPSV